MKNARIMVVEEEEPFGTNLKDMLENLGYCVPCIASSAEEAIMKADLFYPDLVLMDIVLKGEMDGIEVAAIIREKFNLPIIYLSACSDKDTLERAKATQPYCFISKPFKLNDLLNNVELALHKHSMST